MRAGIAKVMSVPQGIALKILEDFDDDKPTLVDQEAPIFPALTGVSLKNVPNCENGNCTISKQMVG